MKSLFLFIAILFSFLGATLSFNLILNGSILLGFFLLLTNLFCAVINGINFCKSL